jgi:hypothetical protein
MRMRDESGLSLIELLVGLAVSALVSAVLAMAIYQIFNVVGSGSGELGAQHDLRNATTWLNRDMASASSVKVYDSRMVLEIPYAAGGSIETRTITYTFSAADGTLTRDFGGSRLIVARRVAAVTFPLTDTTAANASAITMTIYSLGMDEVKSSTLSLAMRPAGEGEWKVVPPTPTGTLTPGGGATPTPTATITPGGPATSTPTATPTATPTDTATATPTPTMVCTDDAYEENDTCSAAAPIAPGTYPDLQICSGDDDWFAVDLQAGDTIRITLNFTHANGDIDMQLYDIACPYDTETVRDEFSATSYSNNNGSVNWSGDWQEIGDEGSPHNGRIRIVNQRLRFREADHNDGIERSADLSGATSAYLSFDWDKDDCEEDISILVSDDGSSFDLLDTFTGSDTSGSENYDISAYASANTTVRFQNVDGNWSSSNDQAFFDNVQIEFTVGSGELAHSWSGTDGEYIEYTVDSAGTYNIWVYGDQGAENSYDMVIEVLAAPTPTVTATPTATPTPTVTPTSCVEDVYEDNDTCGAAAPITSGTYPDLQICSGDDDWFAVDLQAGDTIRITLNFIHADGDIDMQLYGAACPYDTETVRDEFNATSYSNNDGTVNWSGDWQEIGDGGSPHNGRIQIVGGELRFQDANHNDGIERSANLSGATSAYLSFDWRTGHLEEDISIFVSDDGSSFDLLDTFTGIYASGSESYDIGAYASANTTVRFQTVDYDWSSSDDQAFFDDVQIEFTVGSGELAHSWSGTDDEYIEYTVDSTGTYNIWVYGDQGAENSYDMVIEVEAAPTPTVTATPTATPTATVTPTPTMTPTPTATPELLWMYVSDLEGGSDPGWPWWWAEVTVTVRDEYYNLVSSATVSGFWSSGMSGQDWCVTDGEGQCTVYAWNWWWVESVVFTVSDVTHATFIYNEDYEENQTSITIYRP